MFFVWLVDLYFAYLVILYFLLLCTTTYIKQLYTSITLLTSCSVITPMPSEAQQYLLRQVGDSQCHTSRRKKISLQSLIAYTEMSLVLQKCFCKLVKHLLECRDHRSGGSVFQTSRSISTTSWHCRRILIYFVLVFSLGGPFNIIVGMR